MYQVTKKHAYYNCSFLFRSTLYIAINPIKVAFAINEDMEKGGPFSLENTGAVSRVG